MYRIDNKLSNNENINHLRRCNSTLNNYFDNITNSRENILNKTSKNFLSRNKGCNSIVKENIFHNSRGKQSIFRSNSLPKYITQYKFSQKIQAKGTNLPKQYYRKNPYLIPNLFKRFQNNSISKDNSDINNSNEIVKNYKSQDNIEIKENNNYKNINNLGIRERIYKPYLWDNIDKKELINQRDKLMPEGFQFYEKLMEKENKKYFENNYIIEKQPNKKIVPVLIRDKFKKRIEESDIFFQNKNIKKKDSLNEISKNKEKAMEAFYSSDIFNKKINPNIIKKSGEIKYFKDKKKNNNENIMYNKNTETIKGWGERDPIPSLLNYSSSNFNPLNPSIKNCCKTKEKIINECSKKFKGYNPTNKQKSLSEFIDLTNVNASNYNDDYAKVLNKNPNAFKKNENMFTEFYNLYHNYNNISEKPFYKFCPSLINDNNNNNSNNIKSNEL